MIGKAQKQDEKQDRPSEVRVYPARGFMWHRALARGLGRQDPVREFGVSLVIVGFAAGVFSAAAVIDLVRGREDGLSPVACAFLTVLALGVSGLGLWHMRKSEPVVLWAVAILGVAFPVLANLSVWYRYIAQSI